MKIPQGIKLCAEQPIAASIENSRIVRAFTVNANLVRGPAEWKPGAVEFRQDFQGKPQRLPVIQSPAVVMLVAVVEASADFALIDKNFRKALRRIRKSIPLRWKGDPRTLRAADEYIKSRNERTAREIASRHGVAEHQLRYCYTRIKKNRVLL